MVFRSCSLTIERDIWTMVMRPHPGNAVGNRRRGDPVTDASRSCRTKPITASPTQEPLAGFVERVTFHNEENGFFVLRTKAWGDRDLATVVGHTATIAAGEWITAMGDNDRNHGQQFRARFLRRDRPCDAT